MNVEKLTLSVPYNVAADRYREYARVRKAGTGTAVDRTLERAYRTVLRGGRVLDIVSTLQSAGLKADGLPQLAIGRADQRRCYFYRRSGEWWFACRAVWGTRARKPRGTVAVPLTTFPTSQRDHGEARVPFIPPHCRPAHALANYHILWEAEWLNAAPVDPLLLRHIGGPFFAVVTAWNLTPLEQAVMRSL